jgi:NAD(P)H-hydrate epimerase
MVASLSDKETAPLEERLSRFYQQYCPEKLPSVARLADEYAGQGEAELNQMLLDTYGADLTILAASSAASSETPAAAAEEVIEYKSVKYLTKNEARAIDEELMDEDGGWPLEALMELAGKSVADAIYDAYPPKGQAPHPVNGNVKGQVLILCGKGNNGGDGLVAARHLKMYGYDVQVVYPERKNQPPYRGLIKQLQSFDVRVNLGMPGGSYGLGLIVDCAFGFSYKKPLRAPWDLLLKQLTNPEFFGNLPKVSVDVPLGWDVNRGPDLKSGLPVLQPDMLISLTAPKGCAISFKGQHYLGGRFIPYRMNIARQLGLFNAPYQGTSTFIKLPDQAPTSARSEFLKRLVAEGDDEEAEEEKVPAPAAAAAVVAAPAAASATVAAGGGVPDLAVDDVAEVKEVWRPPVWPEPNENIRTAIADMYGEVDAILGEKREGWPAKLRQLVTTQLVPLGWESDYPPDRTTVSKVLFLASKTLYEKDFNNEDLLSEGRTLAERAFEDEGDLEAGKMLKAYAALYAANGDDDAEQMILDDFARIIKTKGYPEDLVPVPTAPEYGFKEKWTISIMEPPAMGGEAIEVMVRPKQKFRVLANAWLKMKDLTEENLGDYEFVVPEMPKTWRSGKIDLEDEIGDTGILDGNGFSVVITNPDVEMALMSAEA